MTNKPKRVISGPGAADFIAAEGGIDRPESGQKGTGEVTLGGLKDDPGGLIPRLGPDTEAHPGERAPDEHRTGSQTGTVGGGGFDAHNDSPVRATGVDDPTVPEGDDENDR